MQYIIVIPLKIYRGKKENNKRLTWYRHSTHQNRHVVRKKIFWGLSRAPLNEALLKDKWSLSGYKKVSQMHFYAW